MVTLALALLLAVTSPGELPYPAATFIIAAESSDGLLVTDGRDAGLTLYTSDGATVILSDQPGAGRNVIAYGSSVLFKECPAFSGQRVVLAEPGETPCVLFEADRFSGPFAAGGEAFIVFSEGSAILVGLQGEIVEAWEIGQFPAWGAWTPTRVWFTGEYGGLGLLGTEDGCVEEPLPRLANRTVSRIETGPGGSLLATCAGETFLLLDPVTGAVVWERDGWFPRWTPEGKIVYSDLEFDGMVPASGDIVVLDPLTETEYRLPGEGVPLHPYISTEGEALWTDMTSGKIAELPGAEPVETTFPGGTDDPAVHFDVPYMHQRWDTPDWFNGSWSCGPTSCIMTVQFYRMLPPDSIWASYPAPGHWSPWGIYIPEEYTFLGHTYDILGLGPGSVWVPGAHGFICREYGGAVWNYMVDFLEQHQVSSAWAGQLWGTLTGELDSGYPVVCSSTVLGSGHIILFNGYYDDHTVVVNDPYGDANEPGWGSHYNGKDVLYDWPGYNNGHVEIGVSQLFYAQAEIPQLADTLVDDRSTGFEKLGDCQYWHLTDGGWGGEGWWTYSTAALPDTCVGRWTPDLPSPGSYTVSVFVPPDHAEAAGIYRITTSSGTLEVPLNQGAYSGEWAELGTWWFNSGAEVVLGDFTGTQGEHIAFDAVLFSPSGTGIEAGGTIPAAGALTVSPNPCAGLMRFSFQPAPDARTMTLWDISGRLAGSAVIEAHAGSASISAAGLPPGVYTARLTGPAGAPITVRLTVLH